LCREKSGYYTADAASAAKVPSDKKFVMVIPPPNVTGTALHTNYCLA
jgi:valyl-tRNA synthetase